MLGKNKMNEQTPPGAERGRPLPS